MKNEIRKLYNAVVDHYSQSIQYNENKVDVLCLSEDFYTIRINDKWINSGKRKYIKKIMKDWMEGKKEIINGFLISKKKST